MKTQESDIRPRKMIYVLAGDPTPLARPRFYKDHIYDSQKQIRLIAGITLQAQHGEHAFFQGPLRIDMNFYLKYSVGRNKGLEATPHTRVPDIDNLIKFICDISTGIIYADDRIVADIRARKWFSSNPRTEFIVSEVGL